MFKRYAIALFTVAAVGVGGWALAQPGPPGLRRADLDGSRYAVTPAGTGAVMVETATGRTWVLQHSADGRRTVWLPADRIDDPKQAEQWRQEDEALKQVLAKRRAAEGRP